LQYILIIIACVPEGNTAPTPPLRLAQTNTERGSTSYQLRSEQIDERDTEGTDVPEGNADRDGSRRWLGGYNPPNH